MLIQTVFVLYLVTSERERGRSFYELLIDIGALTEVFTPSFECMSLFFGSVVEVWVCPLSKCWVGDECRTKPHRTCFHSDKVFHFRLYSHFYLNWFPDNLTSVKSYWANIWDELLSHMTWNTRWNAWLQRFQIILLMLSMWFTCKRWRKKNTYRTL